MEDKQLDATLATVHTLLQAEGVNEAADVVRVAKARAELTGYDNWNGGTDLWGVYFEVPASNYARMGARREQLESQITARLRTVMEQETQNRYTAKIVPARETRKEWRVESPGLPRQTRVNIFDGMRLDSVAWYGQLDEVTFLSRIYDLQLLPSHDSRFNDAAGDIYQHCINNNDYEMDWVYSDDRFHLMDGEAETFLRFLCETAHPVVRPSRDEAVELVKNYNDQLQRVGWEIVEEELIAGRPRFSYRPQSNHGGRSLSRGRAVADALEAGAMARAIERMEKAIDSDPELAIGTAKETIESCCKTVLTKRGVPYGKSDDLGDLTKKVSKELQLVPEGITDEAKGAENIRLILRNLTQITNNLAQLRGLYGTGHGRDGKHRGLHPRHARLAVASAVAFSDFIAETYLYRETPKDGG